MRLERGDGARHVALFEAGDDAHVLVDRVDQLARKIERDAPAVPCPDSPAGGWCGFEDGPVVQRIDDVAVHACRSSVMSLALRCLEPAAVASSAARHSSWRARMLASHASVTVSPKARSA